MSDRSLDIVASQRGIALRELAAQKQEGWVEACLEAALEDRHPFPRSEGTMALSEAPDEDVIPRLAEVIASEEAGAPLQSAAVRWRAERLLIRREPEAALQVVEHELEQADRARRYRAAEVLGRLGPIALELLLQLCSSDDAGFRRRAAKGLAAVAAPGSVGGVVGLIDDRDRTVQLAALKSLARLSENPLLAQELDEATVAWNPRRQVASDDAEVRRAAILAAAKLGPRLRIDVISDAHESLDAMVEIAERESQGRVEVLELLSRSPEGRRAVKRFLSSSDHDLKVAAAFALAGRAGTSADDGLLELLVSSDRRIRLAAVRGLAARSTDPRARSALEAAASDDDDGVRWLAARGLRGQLDRRLVELRRGRLPSEAPSAQWPFGLPAPGPESDRRARLPIALATFNLSYNLNLGVLIRSAEAAGVSEVLVTGRDFYHRLAAMGADRWLEISFFETHAAMVAHARARGYQLVAVQQCPGAERFDRADYPPRPCLVLGSEGPGLPPDLIAQADLVVEIPQRGEIDSLNVATAASIVLWACLSRRGWL